VPLPPRLYRSRKPHRRRRNTAVSIQICSDPQSVCAPSAQPITGSATATVTDSAGRIQFMGTHSRAFTPQDAGRWAVYSTNTGVASSTGVVEMVDWQDVKPGSILVNVEPAILEDGTPSFQEATPYAPRFFLFPPSTEGVALPSELVPNVTATLTSSTTGLLTSDSEEIGSFTLIQPPGGDAVLLDHKNLGYTRDGPGRFGGTIISIPIRAGSVPGKYIVEAEVAGGSSAQSRVIVIGKEDGSDSASASSAPFPSRGDGHYIGALRTVLAASLAFAYLPSAF